MGHIICGPFAVRQQSVDVSITIALRWQGTSLHRTHSAVFCMLTPCIHTFVGASSYIALYHVDLIGPRGGGYVFPYRCLLCISILEKNLIKRQILSKKSQMFL